MQPTLLTCEHCGCQTFRPHVAPWDCMVALKRRVALLEAELASYHEAVGIPADPAMAGQASLFDEEDSAPGGGPTPALPEAAHPA